jgi:hypothetical protein
MGSYEYYARIQVDLAKKDRAPKDAVFQEHDTDEWVTLPEIHNETFQLMCKLWKEGKLKEADGFPTIVRDGYYLAGKKVTDEGYANGHSPITYTGNA